MKFGLFCCVTKIFVASDYLDIVALAMQDATTNLTWVCFKRLFKPDCPDCQTMYCRGVQAYWVPQILHDAALSVLALLFIMGMARRGG